MKKIVLLFVGLGLSAEDKPKPKLSDEIRLQIVIIQRDIFNVQLQYEQLMKSFQDKVKSAEKLCGGSVDLVSVSCK